MTDREQYAKRDRPFAPYQKVPATHGLVREQFGIRSGDEKENAQVLFIFSPVERSRHHGTAEKGGKLESEGRRDARKMPS
jgi:hypothetical protein